MMIEAQKLSLNGDCVLTPIYPVIDDIKIGEEQLKLLKNEHFKRIDLCDAKKLGKEIMYYINYFKLFVRKNRILQCSNKFLSKVFW